MTDEFVGGYQTFLLRVIRPLWVGSGDEINQYLLNAFFTLMSMTACVNFNTQHVYVTVLNAIGNGDRAT